MDMRKAISINQPWAWLIVNGYKDIENRDWRTHRRGEILIHAGKKFDDHGYQWVKDYYPNIKMPDKKDFFMGGIVGSAEISDCVEKHSSEWFFGEFGFVLKNAKPCDPIPCKGALMFFQPNYENGYKS